MATKNLKTIYKTWYKISVLASSRSKDDKDFFAVISSKTDKLWIHIYGCQTEKSIVDAEIHNAKEFVRDIPKIFDSKIKAIILQVFDFKTKKYPNNVHFCEALKAKIDICKIPFCFLSNANINMVFALSAAKVTVNYGEYVLIVENVTAAKLQFTKDGYKTVKHFFSDKITTDINDLQKVMVFGVEDPKKYMDQFKSKNPLLITINPDTLAKCMVEIKKWMLDKSYTKFYVIPSTHWIYNIGYEFGETAYNLLLAMKGIQLPLEAKNTCSRTCFNHFIAYTNPADETETIYKCKMFKLIGNAHEFKLSLKIDINNLPSFEVEKVVHKHIVNFPKFCDSYKIDGIDLKTYPIIGILANRSFICICRNGKFEFLESWGGQWGTQMHISFDKKKPQFGEAAEEILAKHGKYGVQDLLQIMTEGDEAITEITPHGYTFTKDEDNPVLIQFETFNGTKNAASPEFLMAMLLRQQLKAIENEIGEKPTAIGFCVFNVFQEKENKNLRTGLEKACDLMKITDRCFIPLNEVLLSTLYM